LGDARRVPPCHDHGGDTIIMDFTLSAFSNQLADAVEFAAPSVVQVQGRRRPVSGVAYDRDIVVTTTRAIGRGDEVKVRATDGQAHDAELAGWDPATHLVVLRVAGLTGRAATLSGAAPRVGQLALGVARSWSNAVTATAGIVSVIGGPLQTGRHRAIEQVIRTTAPMHDGFAGGAFIDTAGHLIGLSTAAAIRGLGVVIPGPLVWNSVKTVLAGGTRRGYLGIGGQPVELPPHQRGDRASEQALLITTVTAGAPAAAAGVLVGDILLDFDGQAVASPEDLLALLHGDRINRDVPMQVLRGGTPTRLTVRVGERPAG
jgi:S1-C subfamily serine protease